ncbi:MAG: hypothetical protein AB1414_19020 [bacterium]
MNEKLDDFRQLVAELPPKNHLKSRFKFMSIKKIRPKYILKVYLRIFLIF